MIKTPKTLEAALEFALEEEMNEELLKSRISSLHYVNAQKETRQEKVEVELIRTMIEKITALELEVKEVKMSKAMREESDAEEELHWVQVPTKVTGFVTKINELLEVKIIRPSHSAYSSPCFLVHVPNKDPRLVMDFRKLNEVIPSDKYPLPLIDELITKIGPAKYFSVLDFMSGFYQIPIKEHLLEFNRLPLGSKVSPNVFQRMTNNLISDLIGKGVLVFVDILLYAQYI